MNKTKIYSFAASILYALSLVRKIRQSMHYSSIGALGWIGMVATGVFCLGLGLMIAGVLKQQRKVITAALWLCILAPFAEFFDALKWDALMPLDSIYLLCTLGHLFLLSAVKTDSREAAYVQGSRAFLFALAGSILSLVFLPMSLGAVLFAVYHTLVSGVPLLLTVLVLYPRTDPEKLAGTIGKVLLRDLLMFLPAALLGGILNSGNDSGN